MALPKSHLKKLQNSVFPVQVPKRPKSVDTRKQVVLHKFAQGLSLSAAATAAGMRQRELKILMDEDPAFAQDCADAYDQGSDYLEDLALIRAHENDTVLLKLLEARKPEKFSNKRQVNAGVKIVIQSHASTPSPSITLSPEAITHDAD